MACGPLRGPHRAPGNGCAVGPAVAGPPYAGHRENQGEVAR
jgi:hypothetical protein